jgi:AcrR family transcriptional regulator
MKKSAEPPISRGEQQQKYIAGVVYDLISEVGIENLTMRQIADAAKVSLGTITYHFPNKKALITMALDAGYALPDDWNAFDGSPVAQLRRIALFYAFESPKSRWWRFWVNHLALSTRDTELQASQARRFDRQRKFWVKLITDGIRLGELKSGLDADVTADEMLVELHGLVTLQLLRPTPKMRSYARDRIDKMIDAIANPLAEKIERHAGRQPIGEVESDDDAGFKS